MPDYTGKIIVAGVGPTGLGAEQRAALAGCRRLVAAARYRELAAELDAELIAISPLEQALATIAQRLPEGDIGVLVGGDPLFFGIGRRLLARFAPEQLEFWPAVTSVQLACARFRLPWDDARLISLHGRGVNWGQTPISLRTASRCHCLPMSRQTAPCCYCGKLVSDPNLLLAARLLNRPKTAVLTDGRWPPERIAAALQGYLATLGDPEAVPVRLLVAENLGSAAERLTSGSPTEIAGRRFAPLNVLIVLNEGLPPAGPVCGLDDQEFAHQRGMITKAEVRAVTLHRLALPAQGVFWDLGAASGSVSIEAARMAPGLLVCAVEKEARRLADLRANIIKFGAFSVWPLAGEAPEILAALPDPQRIFVGGSGGRLAEIVAAGATRLAAGGRLVVNAVTAATREQAPALLQAAGLAVEISEVTVRRLDAGGQAHNFNPISIVTGYKKSGNRSAAPHLRAISQA